MLFSVSCLINSRHISVSSASRWGRTSRPPAPSSTATAHWPSPCRKPSNSRQAVRTCDFAGAPLGLSFIERVLSQFQTWTAFNVGISHPTQGVAVRGQGWEVRGQGILEFVLAEVVHAEWLPPVSQNLLLLLSLCLFLGSLLTFLLY